MLVMKFRGDHLVARIWGEDRHLEVLGSVFPDDDTTVYAVAVGETDEEGMIPFVFVEEQEDGGYLQISDPEKREECRSLFLGS